MVLHIATLTLLLNFIVAVFGNSPPYQHTLTTENDLSRHKVGRLPALGWNTWNAYRCDISEKLVLGAAHDFINIGLKDAGYQYINIDDCWSQPNRSSTGELVPDFERFPNGIAHVASKIHELGLKVGIYSDAGTHTCAGYPGSLDYEAVDARTFSEWGIDYLKYDNCNVPEHWADQGKPPAGDWSQSKSATRFRRMAHALSLQTRPMEFSICIWGRANVWSWGSTVGHSWRIFDDSQPTWYYIMSIMQTNIQFLDHVNFYAHNDMDMMEIGNGNLRIPEQRTHFAVWAFMKSPILLGTDLRRLSAEQIAIITNRELIAFHQDKEVGTPARPFINAAGEIMSPPEYYSGKSSFGIHVFIVNTNNLTSNKTIDFASVPGLVGDRFLVHDMWSSLDIGVFSESITVTLVAHDTAAYRLTRV